MADQVQRLKGKAALVTGAGRGIGRAIALAYAQEGAVVSCVARTQTEIGGTVREIEKLGGVGLALPADVTQLASVQKSFDLTVEQFGGLDILVVAAGVNLDVTGVEHSVPEDWVNTLNVNLVGAYYCAQAAIPHLKRRGAGKIIMLGSGGGHRGSAKYPAFPALKPDCGC